MKSIEIEDMALPLLDKLTYTAIVFLIIVRSTGYICLLGIGLGLTLTSLLLYKVFGGESIFDDTSISTDEDDEKKQRPEVKRSSKDKSGSPIRQRIRGIKRKTSNTQVTYDYLSACVVSGIGTIIVGLIFVL